MHHRYALLKKRIQHLAAECDRAAYHLAKALVEESDINMCPSNLYPFTLYPSTLLPHPPTLYPFTLYPYTLILTLTLNYTQQLLLLLMFGSQVHRNVWLKSSDRSGRGIVPVTGHA